MRLEDENIQDIAPFGVRMPSELKARIKEAAKKNKHSMNAEIVTRLEMSFRSGVDFREIPHEELIDSIKNAMKGLLDDGIISIKKPAEK